MLACVLTSTYSLAHPLAHSLKHACIHTVKSRHSDTLSNSSCPNCQHLADMHLMTYQDIKWIHFIPQHEPQVKNKSISDCISSINAKSFPVLDLAGQINKHKCNIYAVKSPLDGSLFNMCGSFRCN